MTAFAFFPQLPGGEYREESPKPKPRGSPVQDFRRALSRALPPSTPTTNSISRLPCVSRSSLAFFCKNLWKPSRESRSVDSPDSPNAARNAAKSSSSFCGSFTGSEHVTATGDRDCTSATVVLWALALVLNTVRAGAFRLNRSRRRAEMTIHAAFLAFPHAFVEDLAITRVGLREIGIPKPLAEVHLRAPVAVALENQINPPLGVGRRPRLATAEILLVFDLELPDVASSRFRSSSISVIAIGVGGLTLMLKVNNANVNTRAAA